MTDKIYRLVWENKVTQIKHHSDWMTHEESQELMKRVNSAKKSPTMVYYIQKGNGNDRE